MHTKLKHLHVIMRLREGSHDTMHSCVPTYFRTSVPTEQSRPPPTSSLRQVPFISLPSNFSSDFDFFDPFFESGSVTIIYDDLTRVKASSTAECRIYQCGHGTCLSLSLKGP